MILSLLLRLTSAHLTQQNRNPNLLTTLGPHPSPPPHSSLHFLLAPSSHKAVGLGHKHWCNYPCLLFRALAAPSPTAMSHNFLRPQSASPTHRSAMSSFPPSFTDDSSFASKQPSPPISPSHAGASASAGGSSPGVKNGIAPLGRRVSGCELRSDGLRKAHSRGIDVQHQYSYTHDRATRGARGAKRQRCMSNSPFATGESDAATHNDNNNNTANTSSLRLFSRRSGSTLSCDLPGWRK